MAASQRRPQTERRRATAVALLIAVGAFGGGCSMTPDVVSRRGVAPSPCEREAYVAARSVAPVAPVASAGPWSLGDLLALVEDGSVEVRTVRARVDAAAAEVREARADLLPNLSIDVGGIGYARQPGSSVYKTDRHVADATVELSVPLDLGHRLAESVRAAQARYRSAEHQLRASGREQRLLVARAYFTLLAARDLADVNESALAVQERALRDGRARQEVGTIRRNDVLVIEVALSNTRQRGVTLAAAIRNARRALNAAAGLPIDHPTEVVPFARLIPPEPDVLPLLDRARYDNPEVDVLVETRSALLHDLRSNRGAEWPEVSLGPRIVATTEGIAQPAENFLGFLSVSWNPDLSGRLLAERQGLRAQLVEVAWLVTGVLRGLEERILRAHETALERTSAFDAARTSLSQAEENQRLLLEQFRAGVATGREVLEAQALLSQQEGTLEAARHEVNAAMFELWYLAGLDPVDYLARISATPETLPAGR
jgi:outer membrane protein TolC